MYKQPDSKILAIALVNGLQKHRAEMQAVKAAHKYYCDVAALPESVTKAKKLRVINNLQTIKVLKKNEKKHI